MAEPINPQNPSGAPIPYKEQLLMELLKGGAGTALGTVAKMNPVTAGLSMIPSAIQFVSGLNQAAQAKKIERSNVRPQMQVPNEVATATGLAREQYLDPRMAGQNLAEERLGTSVANTVEAAKEVGAGGAGTLGALVASDRNRQMGFGNLASQAAQQQVADALGYQSALHRQAPYAQQAFEYNKIKPYEEAAASASALREAANKNIFGAVSNAATGLINTRFGGSGQNASPASPPVPPQSVESMPVPPLAPTMSESSMRTAIPQTGVNFITGPQGGISKSLSELPMRETVEFQTQAPSTPERVVDLKAKLGFDPSYLLKAPQGSLYGDEFYRTLPKMNYR